MSNAQKQSFVKGLSELLQVQTATSSNLVGQALPCHVVAVNGQIVTVQFDILPGTANLQEVTIPTAGWEYIRNPVQIGDKGFTVPASVSLRGISGLGDGMATMSKPPSLTALVFVPVGNINWSDVDPDKLTMYGPKGVLARTKAGGASVDIEDEVIVIKAPRIRLEGVIELAGPITQVDTGTGTTARMIGPLNVEQDVTAGDVSLTGHDHDVSGVESGGSTVKSEKPNPG
ncbi:TPA: phage baseplate protein [Enterobacter kobei]|nr:phage baseplate protein [Enterobacter kobei]